MRIIKARELCDQIRGVTYRKGDSSDSYLEGYIPMLRATNIVNGEIDFNELVYIPRSIVKSDQYLRKGDVLIAASSGSLHVVGKAARIREDLDVSFGTFCKLLRPNDLVNKSYFAHFFQTPYYRFVVSNLAAGANINNLRNEHIEDLDIPLPPQPEQKRIASILDKADVLRQKRLLAIKRLDDLLQSVFLDTFGDPETNSMRWEVRNLGEIFEFRTGKLNANAMVEGGQYPFFTCAREIYSIDSFAFDCEALLVAGNNATADYWVKYFKGKFNAYQRTYVITIQDPNISYKYMRLALEAKLSEMKLLSKGTNTRYLTLTILKSIKIQIPSLESMIIFDKLHDKILVRRIQMEEGLSKFYYLYHSLQQRAFKGELSIGIEEELPLIEVAGSKQISMFD